MVRTRNHGRAAKRTAIKRLSNQLGAKVIFKHVPKHINRVKKGVKPNRPAYKTMVIQSVKMLGTKHGSSVISIRKYIANHYKDVKSNSVYIKKALSGLIFNGALVSSKAHPKSFKLVEKASKKARRLVASQSVARPASTLPSSINEGSLVSGPSAIVLQPSTSPCHSATGVIACADINRSKYVVSVLNPYNIDLNLTDCSKNMDKFYKMQVVKSECSTMFWFVQNWGRNGTKGQSQTNGPFRTQLETTDLMEAKFKTKTGIAWADRARANNSSSSTGKYEIQRRLAAAGAGRSTKSGSVAVSLMWDHSDVNKRNDLDLWVVSPSGERVGYSHKRSTCGGELDVDRRQDALRPVENIVWKNQTPKGKFEVWVHNYSANHTTEIPFHVSIVIDGGEMEMIAGNMPGENKKWIRVKTINYQ